MASYQPLRSALYMPGTNARALEKAAGLEVDCVIMDLEDGVAPDVKADARSQIQTALKTHDYGRRTRIVRLNEIGSAWFEDDARMAVAAASDGILVPKINGPDDLHNISNRLSAIGAPKSFQVWLMMETAMAMLNIAGIARTAASQDYGFNCFVMGTNDLAKETGAAQTPDRLPMLFWLSSSVTAARAYGLSVLDGVSNNFSDIDRFRAECVHGKELGMDGKTLIHPKQVAVCNETFSPSDEEITWSRKIITAFEEPQNKGQGVISVEGKMVEILHLEIARKTVAIADAIADAA